MRSLAGPTDLSSVDERLSSINEPTLWEENSGIISINMPKLIKSKNMAIQHIQGCSNVLIGIFCIFWKVPRIWAYIKFWWIVNKYAQHGFWVSIFKYKQHMPKQWFASQSVRCLQCSVMSLSAMFCQNVQFHLEKKILFIYYSCASQIEIRGDEKHKSLSEAHGKMIWTAMDHAKSNNHVISVYIYMDRPSNILRWYPGDAHYI